MCMEDIKIGRETNSTQVIATVTGTSGVLIGASKNRIALVVSPPIAGRITLSLGETAVDQQGIVLAATDSPLVLMLDRVGEIVTRKITAITDGGTSTIGMWETILKVA